MGRIVGESYEPRRAINNNYFKQTFLGEQSTAIPSGFGDLPNFVPSSRGTYLQLFDLPLRFQVGRKQGQRYLSGNSYRLPRLVNLEAPQK